MGLSIELDTCPFAALQDYVDLRVILMVVLAGIAADLGQMNSARKLIPFRKCASGEPAGTLHRCNRSQIDNFGFG